MRGSFLQRHGPSIRVLAALGTAATVTLAVALPAQAAGGVYVLDGGTAREQIRSDGAAKSRLGRVRTSTLDGLVGSTLGIRTLPLAPSSKLVLLIRAYKVDGHPVGGVAAQRRVGIPIASGR